MPWTLLSAGVGFRPSSERVRTALEQGASGFIAGRAIWGEAASLSGAERVEFLEETAVPRMAVLSDLLAEQGRLVAGSRGMTSCRRGAGGAADRAEGPQYDETSFLTQRFVLGQSSQTGGAQGRTQ